MTLTMYGIRNCDTVKKARTALEERGVAYTFHDFKSAGIERSKLEDWAKRAGWERVLNRNGLTFKRLADKDKEGLNQDKAIALMMAQPSMIKRPVLETPDGNIIFGFQRDAYAELK